MSERAMGWLPDRARDVQGWVQDRAQALPRAPWMQTPQGQVPPPLQQGWVSPATFAAAPPTAPLPLVPNPMGPGRPPEEHQGRRWPKRVLIGAGLVAVLTLGACVGGLGSAGENADLREEVQLTTGQLDAAVAERDELQTLVGTQEEDLAEATSDAVEAASTLETVESDLTTAQAALTTAEADLTTAQATVAERDATIAALQAELAAAQAAAAPAIAPLVSAPSQPAAAAPAAPAAAPSAYYQNCTAVRNAGAAPISVGQPGYGRHLDRDGDGIACE